MATRKATTVKHDQYLLDVRRLAADSSKNHQTSDDLTIAAGSGGSSVPSNTLYKISSAKSESCIKGTEKNNWPTFKAERFLYYCYNKTLQSLVTTSYASNSNSSYTNQQCSQQVIVLVAVSISSLFSKF